MHSSLIAATDPRSASAEVLTVVGGMRPDVGLICPSRCKLLTDSPKT